MKPRDLTAAEWLRPAEVRQVFGLAPSTVRQWCINPDPAKRLPSRLIQGKSGRKGVRLIKRSELEAYLDRHTP